MNSCYALLVQCARLATDAAFCAQLERKTAVFSHWSQLISLAEEQNLAPLLYWHIQKCNLTIPSEARLQLQGLVLRHKEASRLRVAVMADILRLLQRADIQSLVLKGGALAHLVYPHPGLRPMSDLDILLPPEQAAKAQQLLQQHGFQENLEAEPAPAEHRHLPILMKILDGLTISVEIHRTLSSGLLMAEGKPFEALWATAVSFAIDDQPAKTLSPADMLWHLYQHTLAEPTRLIRLVDMTAVAEQYAAEIDWVNLRQEHPELLATLSNLHFVSPLSNNLQQKAGLILKQRPAGTEVALYDWPPLPRIQWGGKSRRHIWRRTFFPSEFSLRLYYGVPNRRSCWRQRWLQHPLQIVRWWVQRRW